MKFQLIPLLALFAIYVGLFATSSAFNAPHAIVEAPHREDIKCSQFDTCGGCIQANADLMRMVGGSPIRDICQWCRYSGTCFNSTEESPVPSSPKLSLKSQAAEKCSIRCTVKTIDMCPPMDLLCGGLMTCSNCTNHSFCDFCDTKGGCFNPCGDDRLPPEAVPSAFPVDFEPLEDTVPSYAPDREVVPLSDSKEGLSQRQFGFSVQTPFTCDSCVWSTIGQCKMAEHCASLKGCSACTAQPSCGWCGNNGEGKCVVADVNHRPCAGMTCKYWSYGNCEASCNSHSDCSTCIADTEGRCNWCAGGVLGGRKTSFCGTSSVLHECALSFTDECPDCKVAKNCTTCLQRPNCGYCAFGNPTLSTCVEGNKQGPFDPSDCTTSPEPEIGWIQKCQAWNATTPPQKPAPPQDAPMEAPSHETPQTAPAHPPAAPPTKPPAAPPVLAPVAPPHGPAPTLPPTHPQPAHPPAKPPSAPVPHTTEPDPHFPAKFIEPYQKENKRAYTIAIITGASIAGAVVIGGGILWVKLHASATHRHRAIG